MKNSIKAVITFYICAYAFTYGSFVFLPFSDLSLSERLVWELMWFSILFFLVIVATTLFIGKWTPERVGWGRENFSRSFLWVSALLVPVTLGNLVTVHVGGIGAVMKSGGFGIRAPYPFWLPFFGIAFWALSGATSFSLLQAFPYECLRAYAKKYVLPGIALLFILWYNAPLLTGALKLGDILWLGIVFLFVYHKFHNSLSLILAYVALFELPILWCFGAAWGNMAFLTMLYARTCWCVIAWVALIYRGVQQE